MRRALALGFGILAIGTLPALAADIPAKVSRPAPVMAPVAYNWTGIYTASSAGGQWWDIKGTYATGAPDPHNSSGSRFIYGSHLGAQYQFGNWVVGLEGSYNRGFVPEFTRSNSVSGDCLSISGTANRSCESRVRSYWTVGGKIGYAWDNWMIYGIGGYANGRLDDRTLVTSTGAILTQGNGRHSGWFAGAGVDVFVTKLWWSDLILGIEYTHVDLGTARHSSELINATVAEPRDYKATVDTLRVKLTSKLNWGLSPVVARY